jgi:hypothetical protein
VQDRFGTSGISGPRRLGTAESDRTSFGLRGGRAIASVDPLVPALSEVIGTSVDVAAGAYRAQG